MRVFEKAIRATSMIWKWRGWRKARAASAHHEGVELVAFGITEIGGVELFTAMSGRTFAFGAERKRELVDAIDLGLVFRPECRHHAVADRHRLAVIGKCHAEARAAARTAPGDEAVVCHEPAHAQLAANLVIELTSLFQIIGADGDVTDHDFPPFEFFKDGGVLQLGAGGASQGLRRRRRPRLRLRRALGLY